MLRDMRIAVCGDLPTACRMLRQEGVLQIDSYADSIDLSVRLRRGEKYHLILVHAPYGAGLGSTEYSYKTALDSDWETVPVRLMNEPAYPAELSEVKLALQAIAKVREGLPDGQKKIEDITRGVPLSHRMKHPMTSHPL